MAINFSLYKIDAPIYPIFFVAIKGVYIGSNIKFGGRAIYNCPLFKNVTALPVVPRREWVSSTSFTSMGNYAMEITFVSVN